MRQTQVYEGLPHRSIPVSISTTWVRDSTQCTERHAALGPCSSALSPRRCLLSQAPGTPTGCAGPHTSVLECRPVPCLPFFLMINTTCRLWQERLSLGREEAGPPLPRYPETQPHCSASPQAATALDSGKQRTAATNNTATLTLKTQQVPHPTQHGAGLGPDEKGLSPPATLPAVVGVDKVDVAAQSQGWKDLGGLSLLGSPLSGDEGPADLHGEHRGLAE